jgi:hypothetical protein
MPTRGVEESLAEVPITKDKVRVVVSHIWQSNLGFYGSGEAKFAVKYSMNAEISWSESRSSVLRPDASRP